MFRKLFIFLILGFLLISCGAASGAASPYGERVLELSQTDIQEHAKLSHAEKAEFIYGTKEVKTNEQVNLIVSKEKDCLRIRDNGGKHGLYDLQISWNVIEPYIQDNTVKVTHFNDAGIPDAVWIQSIRNDGGYAYFEDVPFSEVIIGGYTGVYRKEFTSTNNATSLSLGSTFESDTIDFVNVSINSPGVNLISADYAVGTLYTPTDGVYLTDVNGENSTKTLTAGKLKSLGLLTVDTTAHSITEEFIVANTATSNNPTVIDNCDSAKDWNVFIGNGTITTENGKLKVVGTTDEQGRIYVRKSVSLDLSGFEFFNLNISSSQTGCTLIAYPETSAGVDVAFYDTSGVRFKLNGTSETRFVLPIKAPVGSTGQLPSRRHASYNPAVTTMISVGLRNGVANSAITFYVDNITADTYKTAYIELQTPDNLADSSLTLQAWDGSAYQTIGTYKLDSTYSAVGTPTSANWKLADGTKFDDVYGSGLGRALFPKGVANQTVNGSNGTMTYTDDIYGAKNKIGFRVDLPPSDGNRTNFDQVRFRTTIFYNNTSNITYEVDDDSNITASYIDNNKLIGYFNESDIYDSGLSFATNSNNTFTDWDGENISLIRSSNDDDLSSIRILQAPLSFTGVTIVNATAIYTPTVDIGYTENTTLINESSNNVDHYDLNIQFIPGNNYLTGGRINYTTTETDILEADLLDIESNEAVTFNQTSGLFSFVANTLTAGQTYYYNVSIDWTNIPETDFAASLLSGDAKLTTQFTDSSTNIPTSWHWNFGDGETSDDQNPMHIYEDEGTYTVSLTTTNAAGSNTETKTHYITVIGPVTVQTQVSQNLSELHQFENIQEAVEGLSVNVDGASLYGSVTAIISSGYSLAVLMIMVLGGAAVLKALGYI